MLTDRQKKIIENWDDQDEGKKKPIREKFRKSIADLPFLREIPPEEAREIVQSAIMNYADIDERSKLTDHDEKAARDGLNDLVVHERYDFPFIKNVTSILFNSVSENNFQRGINKGVENTVTWWRNNDVGEFFSLMEYGKKHRIENEATKNKLQYPNRTISLATPPKNKTEQLIRILAHESKEGLARPSLLSFYLENNVFELDIQKIKQDLGRGVNDIEEVPLDTIQDDLSIPYTKVSKLLEVKKAINRNQKKAKKIAYHINHPKNNSFNTALSFSFRENPAEFRWIQRELIELHREYLIEEGIMPDEEKLPEYPDVFIGVPRPSQLNLRSWNTKADFTEG
ncbi:hypothetical protein [Halohasta litorea]|uniref:Uncharacterized protein n=1 Tax=Halohasta litorea TaxID=869891 RepID=A0ABD6DBF4_9EURY|nr:hypothetical protein [Halohasta litorea]